MEVTGLIFEMYGYPAKCNFAISLGIQVLDHFIPRSNTQNLTGKRM